MSALSDRLAGLSPKHREALEWFQSRRTEIIPWPDPLNGVFLMGRAKGIFVPKGWPYALSLRQTLTSPYTDSAVNSAHGTWTYRYHQENQRTGDPDSLPSNRALMACYEDGVPVAVLVQTQARPTALYQVLGLARVASWEAGVFHLEGYSNAGDLGASTEGETGQSELSGPGQPLDLTDARRRINAQIVARQGGKKFRQAAFVRYAGKCAISGCGVEHVLEAAHIVPYLHKGTNVPDNSLLLRGDLHTLFDRHRLRIDPMTLRVVLDKELEQSADYGVFSNREIVLPSADRKSLSLRLGERARLFMY